MNRGAGFFLCLPRRPAAAPVVMPFPVGIAVGYALLGGDDLDLPVGGPDLAQYGSFHRHADAEVGPGSVESGHLPRRRFIAVGRLSRPHQHRHIHMPAPDPLDEIGLGKDGDKDGEPRRRSGGRWPTCYRAPVLPPEERRRDRHQDDGQAAAKQTSEDNSGPFSIQACRWNSHIR